MTELALTLEATDDERLAQAEALVRAYCGWHIAPSRTDTVTFTTAPRGAVLMLPSLHVTAVSGVSEDGIDLVVTDDFLWSESGILTRYWWAVAPIEVEFTHGYEDPPPEVTAVVQAIAQRAVNNPGGMATSRGIGPFSESYGSLATGTALSLLESEKEVLRRYRIPVVA